MKNDQASFDTNVIVYAFAEDESRTGIPEALEALSALRVLCPSPVPLTVQTHDTALRITGRFGYNSYDSLVIAAALEARCTTLFSEDLHAGQVIDGLTIRNPFAQSKSRLSK
jgi:predicted nucleic acid-binding protein